jgi:exodeoxyribonuclease VII large subunit
LETILSQQNILTLSELNFLIRKSITSSFPDACWVTAEIASINSNQKGHCYLELVEKQDETILAQMKANIWAYNFRNLVTKFETVTKESLKTSMKVLILVTVQFHEVYGLSLNVIDIDPTYSLGEMARKKKEAMERLKKENLIGRNKSLSLPLVPQRIAIVSSPTAAGYGDFTHHLNNNPYGYKFVTILYSALMQGEDSEQSIISALNEIQTQSNFFNLVVIIRGGGSQVDLSCFDSYNLASKVAMFPLPVITGIGHERDDTVVDMVAHTRLKTPTAVAEFIISVVRSFEEMVIELQRTLVRQTERLIKDKRHDLDTNILHVKNSLRHYIERNTNFLNSINDRFNSGIKLYLKDVKNKLSILKKDFQSHLREAIQKEDSRLKGFDQAVRHLDPVNILKRGYSITFLNGKTLKNIEGINKGDIIQTRLYKGLITSTVESSKKGK